MARATKSHTIKPTPMTPGQRFGRLFIVSFAGRDKHTHAKWNVRCDCGNDVTVLQDNLRRGTTTSCGCLSSELKAARLRTHGQTETPEFEIWSGMITRCTNPNHKSFSDYGQRGISVCDRWLNFEHFLSDMGPRPTTKHSIERKDNEAGYQPSNCKWATKTEQMRNRRNSVFVELNGTRRLLVEVCDETGISYKTARQRLSRGWTAERAFNLEC